MGVSSTDRCFQKPGETLDWIFAFNYQEHLHFLGVGETAVNVTYMWGLTGPDRDGKLLGGVKRWYTIESSQPLTVWQWFRTLVSKEGGGTDDFFRFDAYAF
jgi:hypothetical protein